MLAVVCEAGRVQLSIAAVPVGGGGVDGGGGGRRPAALVLRAAGGCCCAHIIYIYTYMYMFSVGHRVRHSSPLKKVLIFGPVCY